MRSFNERISDYLYIIEFNNVYIEANHLFVIIDAESAVIELFEIETRYGRFIYPKDRYLGVGSSIFDFLRREALCLGYKVSFAYIQDKNSTNFRNLIKQYFKEIMKIGGGGIGAETLWDGEELGYTVIGTPRKSPGRSVSSPLKTYPLDVPAEEQEKISGSYGNIF